MSEVNQEGAESVPQTDQIQTQESPDTDDTAAVIADLESQLAKVKAKNSELHGERIKAKRRAEEAALEAARRTQDVESIEQSLSQQFASREAELSSELDQYKTMIHQITSAAEAERVANELALPNSKKVLLNNIKHRFRTEIVDGVPRVRILDENGSLTGLSVDELKKELLNDPGYSPILRASKAKGAGAISKSGMGSTKKFNEMTAQELKDLRDSNPSKYDSLKDEYYKSNRRF